VLVVDDQPEFLRAARALLAGDPRLVVVGEAPSGREALALLAALAPDVVILDVQMPGMTGFETAQALRALAPDVRLLLTSNLEVPAYRATAGRLGAAFLPKKGLSPRAVLELLQAPPEPSHPG
jgi:DNA-binding NarL/FixJ family response regulator